MGCSSTCKQVHAVANVVFTYCIYHIHLCFGSLQTQTREDFMVGVCVYRAFHNLTFTCLASGESNCGLKQNKKSSLAF